MELMITIDCVSDLHGHFPKLEGGDLLIVAGDLTARDTEDEYVNFSMFMWDQISCNKYKKVIWIAGNHDNWIQDNITIDAQLGGGEYLCDSGTEFEYEEVSNREWGSIEGPLGSILYEKKKLKIWGSPWTRRFEGMNPHCMAFTVDTEEGLAEKWALIPDDIDILVTHSPPAGRLLDKTKDENFVGSESLYQKTSNSPRNLKLHVFGHIHEAYGKKYWKPTKYVNASHVNEHYQPVNKPIRIIL